MNASQKEQLFSNLAAAMQGVPERIQVRQLVHFYKADPDYGRGVAGKLGLDMKKYAAWAKLTLKDLFEKTTEENYGR
jgi:catalase